MPALYETQLLEARKGLLKLTQDQANLLKDVFVDAHTQVTNALAKYADSKDIIKTSRLQAVKRELEAIFNDTITTAGNYMLDDISAGVKLATDANLKVGMAYIAETDPKLLADFGNIVGKGFATINKDAVTAVIARLYDDNKSFSDRIWDLRNISKTMISRVVGAGVAQGMSARNLARQLEPMLKGFKELKGTATDEEFIPIWNAMRKERADLRYQALRLARTETNNAFREGMVKSAQRAAWIKGVKWNLSGSHKKTDICNVYATRDIDGLGAGVYLPQNVPIDHPNGLCHLTTVVASKEEFLASIAEGTKEFMPEPVPEKVVVTRKIKVAKSDIPKPASFRISSKTAEELRKEAARFDKLLDKDSDKETAAETKQRISRDIVLRVLKNNPNMKLNRATASDWITAWAKSSADTNPVSLALQQAVKDEFGLAQAATEHLFLDNATAVARYAKHGEEMRAFVRAQYELTQEFLKDHKYITLYRGMSFDSDQAKVAGLLFDNKVKNIDIGFQPISSFSTNMDTAFSFTQGSRYTVLIQTETPRERILSTCQTGFGCKKEAEMVVLGGKENVKSLSTDIFKDIRLVKLDIWEE